MKLQLNWAIWACFQTLGECAPLVAKLNTLTTMAKKGNTLKLKLHGPIWKDFSWIFISSLNTFLIFFNLIIFNLNYLFIFIFNN